MIEKLRNQLSNDVKDIYLTKIVEGIESIAETDAELTETLSTSARTLGECWNYIRNKAQAEAKNGCACIEDNVVYGWAIEFYKLSNEELEELKPKKAEPKKITPKVEKVENEASEEVEKENKEDIAEITPISAPKRDCEAKKKIKPELALDGQASIFDFMGV